MSNVSDPCCCKKIIIIWVGLKDCEFRLGHVHRLSADCRCLLPATRSWAGPSSIITTASAQPDVRPEGGQPKARCTSPPNLLAGREEVLAHKSGADLYVLARSKKGKSPSGRNHAIRHVDESFMLGEPSYPSVGRELLQEPLR